jgi:hypothetical protein
MCLSADMICLQNVLNLFQMDYRHGMDDMILINSLNLREYGYWTILVVNGD